MYHAVDGQKVGGENPFCILMLIIFLTALADTVDNLKFIAGL